MAQRAPFVLGTALTTGQLQAFVDHARDLFALVSPEGVILSASPGFSKTLGYAADELLGTCLFNLFHQEDEAPARLCFSSIGAKQDATVTDNCRLRTRRGAWRLFEGSMRNLTEDPSVEAMVLCLHDVTERRRLEAERQVISEVIHALNETSNLDQLLARIHQALKKVLYAENCFIALHDAESNMFHFPFLVDRFDTAPPPQKVGKSCTAYVFRTGRACLIPQDEFDRLAAAGEVELVGSPSPSWLGVPLKTPTATIGVLVVQHYEDENAYSERDMEFLDSVGGHIALAIERRRSDESLVKSESLFRQLFSHNPLPTWLYDRDTMRFLQVNRAAIELYGYSEQEFLCLNASVLETLDGLDTETPGPPGTADVPSERRHRRKDGKTIDVEVHCDELEFAGRPAVLVVARDIGEHRLLEEQFRQAQKMEAVGQLAGGVAHDFNNMLMVIKGHTELLLGAPDAPVHLTSKIQHIDRAADRAASLTRQLLAFSRRQVLQPRVINLNEVVEEMGRLLPRLIGEDIDLVIRAAADLGQIRADASQMEQVIMNLAVNARDAMADGGRITIETENSELDHTYSSRHPIVQAGRYVLLAVTDTGSGMDAETQEHIFEPFFTTKGHGKGTGLGLATVYGVVKQSGGFIWVYSEPGKGTSFKIYLPRVDQKAERAEPPQLLAEVLRGTETLLLAEDEQDVREVAREFLESGGYTVLEARDGYEALRVAQEFKGTIDLLVTDMVMPGMTGEELAGRLQPLRKGLRVIFMSGYTEQAAVRTFTNGHASRLLSKPFNRALLLRAVRELLIKPAEQ